MRYGAPPPKKQETQVLQPPFLQFLCFPPTAEVALPFVEDPFREGTIAWVPVKTTLHGIDLGIVPLYLLLWPTVPSSLQVGGGLFTFPMSTWWGSLAVFVLRGSSSAA